MTKRIVVRDRHERLKEEGIPDSYEFPNGIEVLDEEGRALFDIELNDDGSLEISGGDSYVSDGVMHKDSYAIQPVAFNRVRLIKTTQQLEGMYECDNCGHPHEGKPVSCVECGGCSFTEIPDDRT